MKTLVAYYSRTGNTRLVAQAVAERLGADTEEITEPSDRGGVLRFVQSALETRSGKTPTINPASRDPSAYDLIVVGTPVWAGTLATPVKAYLTEHAGRLPAVAFLCTMKAQGSRGAFKDMQRLCGKAPKATLEVNESLAKSGGYTELLEGFAESLLQPQRPQDA